MILKGMNIYQQYAADKNKRRRWWKKIERDILTYEQLVAIGQHDYPLQWLLGKKWSPNGTCESEINEPDQRKKIRRIRLENIMDVVAKIPELKYVYDVYDRMLVRPEHQRTHFVVWSVYSGKESLATLRFMDKYWPTWTNSDTASLFDLLNNIGSASKKWPKYFSERGMLPMSMVDMKNLMGWLLDLSSIGFNLPTKAMGLMDNPIQPEVAEFWDYFQPAVDSLVGQVDVGIIKDPLSIEEWWAAGKAGTSGSARGEKVLIDGKLERMSKNGLVGLYTWSEAKAKIEVGNNNVTPVEKQDRGKGRVIWSSDWESIVDLMYVRYLLANPELRIRGYALGLQPRSKMALTMHMISDGVWRMPMDIDSFDSHFTQEIRKIIQDSIYKNWIAPMRNGDLEESWWRYVRRLSKVTVIVQSPQTDPKRREWIEEVSRMEKEGKITDVLVSDKTITFNSENGLFSGQVDTSLMGTIFTLASQIATYNYLIDKFGVKAQLTEVAAGDDTELTFASYRVAVLYYYTVQAMGLRVNPTKFWIDLDRTEFLRVNVTDRAKGYIARGVGSMVERQPGKSTELTQEEKYRSIIDAVALCTLRSTNQLDLFEFNNMLLRKMGSVLGVNKGFNIPTSLGGLGIASKFVSLRLTGKVITREAPVFNSFGFKPDNAVLDANRVAGRIGMTLDTDNWIALYMDRVKESIDNSELSKKLATDYKEKFLENEMKRKAIPAYTDPRRVMDMYRVVSQELDFIDGLSMEHRLNWIIGKRPLIAGRVPVDERVMFVKSQEGLTEREKVDWLQDSFGKYAPSTCRTPTERWDYLTKGVGLVDSVEHPLNPDLGVLIRDWFMYIVEPMWGSSTVSFATMVLSINCVWFSMLERIVGLFNRLNF
jgi:hypothetical protein